jgi:hypothetical protein
VAVASAAVELRFGHSATPIGVQSNKSGGNASLVFAVVYAPAYYAPAYYGYYVRPYRYGARRYCACWR